MEVIGKVDLDDLGKVVMDEGIMSVLISDRIWSDLTTDIEILIEENKRLQEALVKQNQETDIARTEQKYKLKKLSKIVERKQKQLDALQNK